MREQCMNNYKQCMNSAWTVNSYEVTIHAPKKKKGKTWNWKRKNKHNLNTHIVKSCESLNNVSVWIQYFPLNPTVRISSFSFFLLFFAHVIGDKSYCAWTVVENFDFLAIYNTLVGPVNSARDPQTSLFNNFFIKNGSHDTIHTFKNYFATVFSVSAKISSIQTNSMLKLIYI